MKFVLIVLCAIILVTSSQIISLEDLLRNYDPSSNIATNNIGNVKVAIESLSIPMSLRSCTNDACNFVCRYLGYNHGTCVSSDTCRCYS